jgi:CBS domain-containing protein
MSSRTYLTLVPEYGQRDELHRLAHRLLVRAEGALRMSPSSQTVAEYTSHGPYAVGPNEPLGNARRLMEKYSLRELPVRAEGRVVGLLSEHDLRLVWMLMRPPPEALAVEVAMKAAPYTVESSTQLDEVIRSMAARDVDVAVVLESGRVIGVFTPADAMHALADALEGKLTRTNERSRSLPSAPRHSRGRIPR